MLERAKRWQAIHLLKRGAKRRSDLQLLNQFYQQECFILRGAYASLCRKAKEIPTVAVHLSDATRAIAGALDTLRNEYERDRSALIQHTIEGDVDEYL